VHNNPPPVNELASSHAGRAPSLSTAARAHPPIASTAAPRPPPPTGLQAARSRSSANAQRTKCSQIRSAKPLARRTQPRTVDAGTPSSSAITLKSTPDAAATSARPITSTASSRRHKHQHGNSTCQRPQPRHHARRGCSQTSTGGHPPAIRTGRSRAQPRGATDTPHPGHANKPAAN
jgi:hypothetical protein